MMGEATGELFPAYELELNTTMTQNDTLNEINLSEITSSDDNISSFAYCETYLKPFAKSYSTFHGYNSLIICLFGAQANILNLIILTRKEMRNPTNAILTGLAVADLANMLEYIPFAIYRILLPKSNSYEWALYVLIHSNFSQVCHTTAIWLAVTLAVWRYVMVTRYSESRTLCSMKRAKRSVFAAYLFSALLCTPIYLSFAVRPVERIKTGAAAAASSSSSIDESIAERNGTVYVVNMSDLALKYSILKTTNFWLYSVVIKMIPRAIFTIVSRRLMNSLEDLKIQKSMLFPMRAISTESNKGENNSERQQTTAGRASFSIDSFGSDLTTRMLLAILFLFLITEFPQGLLGLMSGVLGDEFFNKCYIPLGDLMDIVALLNSAINFILYCTMSEKFRLTFVKVFNLNGICKMCPSRRRRDRIFHANTQGT